MTPLLWIGFFIALAMLAVGAYFSVRGDSSLVEQRLGQYLDEQRAQPAQKDKDRRNDGVITTWITKRVEPTSYGERIARELAQADLKFKTGEYLGIIASSSFLVGLIGYYLGGVFFAVIGTVFGLFLPRFFVRYQQKQRLQKFNDQLPDMLNLMVNSLRTGFSALQSMEAVSQELPSPISDEFRRVVQEMQLGVPMEGALENLQRRIVSDDLDLAVTAINIQREVGGNLAEILDTISFTIRERVRMQGEIRAITSQVTFSGRFLAVMPIIISLVLWALNRDYMMEFFQDPIICGIAMLGTAGLMLIFGFIVLNKLADVEI